MNNIRVIARLDVKAPFLIKGVHLEGLRKIGDPQEFARSYYTAGADEIIYMDIVASLYNRNSLSDIVRYTAERVFIPITVGGGIRSLNDVETALRCGADKVAINTAALARPALISEVAKRFGSQCMVISIEAKRAGSHWEAYTDNGREHSGLDVVEWARRAVDLGAGEILLTSVDREGTRKGFDIELTRAVSDAVSVPVIASGGLGDPKHLVEVVTTGHADAVAIADALHYKRLTLAEIRAAAAQAGLRVKATVTANVVIVDYGSGNLLSVCRAFEACGASVDLTGSPQRVAEAKYLVIPGVGAFGDCRRGLDSRNLVEPIFNVMEKGNPVLGICVGMQMMMEIGEEFGEHSGLGIVPGRVRAIPSTTNEGKPHKIPHIGWSELRKATPRTDWRGTILDGVDETSACYFVHSFTADPLDDAHRLADCDYNGRRISAAIRSGRVYGTQFHPEKSGEIGLRIIRNFLTVV